MPCVEHLAQLRERRADLDRLGAAVVAVTFESPAEVADFARRKPLPYPIYSDPGRRAYAAFGLRRGRSRQIWNWNTLKAYVRGIRQGRWPRLPHGDLAQLGGDFVIDAAGRIVLAHRSGEPADRPTVEEVLAAVRHAVTSDE